MIAVFTTKILSHIIISKQKMGPRQKMSFNFKRILQIKLTVFGRKDQHRVTAPSKLSRLEQNMRQNI